MAVTALHYNENGNRSQGIKADGMMKHVFLQPKDLGGKTIVRLVPKATTYGTMDIMFWN